MIATFRSETHVATNGARVEVGTMSFEGRDFAATGSIVDEARGYVVGYVHTLPDGRYELRTWGGETIAPLRKTGSWKVRTCFGGWPVTMRAWAATINGRRYSGRNGSEWDLLRMRASGRAEGSAT